MVRELYVWMSGQQAHALQAVLERMLSFRSNVVYAQAVRVNPLAEHARQLNFKQSICKADHATIGRPHVRLRDYFCMGLSVTLPNASAHCSSRSS